MDLSVILEYIIPYVDSYLIFEPDEYENYNPSFIENGLRCHISIHMEKFIRVDFINIKENTFQRSSEYVQGTYLFLYIVITEIIYIGFVFQLIEKEQFILIALHKISIIRQSNIMHIDEEFNSDLSVRLTKIGCFYTTLKYFKEEMNCANL